MAVTYKSIDKDKRIVTFDVDGVEIIRYIPLKLVNTIDEYITALANGLQIERSDRKTRVHSYTVVSEDGVKTGYETKSLNGDAHTIDEPSFTADDVVIEDPSE